LTDKLANSQKAIKELQAQLEELIRGRKEDIAKLEGLLAKEKERS